RVASGGPLRKRTPRLNPVVVGHGLDEPAVVEAEGESPADVRVSEERRGNRDRIRDGGRVEPMVEPQEGHGERGSVLHNAQGRRYRSPVWVQDVPLVVPIDRGRIRVPGEEHELAGQYVAGGENVHLAELRAALP